MSDGERVIARLTIERFIDADGADLVRVDSDDLNGGRVAVVEALGLLQLAIYDISNHEEVAGNPEGKGADE